MFEHEHQAQRNADIGRVGAGLRFVQLGSDVLPRRLAAMIRGQMPHQLAHVGERRQGHDAGDFQRTREAARPVGALGHSAAIYGGLTGASARGGIRAMNRAVLYEQLHYTERHIAAGAEAIEKQRQGIAHMEARGDAVTLAPARALLAQMERSHAQNIAERNRICGLLDT